MAIELISKIKPKNNGTFPLVDAADVEMPDGTRLSEFNGGGGGSGSGVVIDPTLTQEGQAADAKAVGDALNEIGQMAQGILPSLLPVVTAADNGKILQVVDGAWGAVAMTDVSEVGM